MPSRKTLAAYKKQPFVIACIGDSITHNYTTVVCPHEFWPTQTAELLNDAGFNVIARNLGRSGNTSGQMVGRIGALSQYGVPAVVAIMIGVNDPTVGTNSLVVSATTTSAVVTAGYGAYYSVGCWVTIAGASRQLTSVATDTLGWTTPLSGVPSVGARVYLNTQKNIEQVIDSLALLGTTKFIVLTRQYLNFGIGVGDTVTTEYSNYSTPNNIRNAQLAAVATYSGSTTIDVISADAYNAFKALIVATPALQGNNGYWHVRSCDIAAYEAAPPAGSTVEVDNQHLNVVGEGIVALCVKTAVVAANWLGDLS